MKHHLIRLFAVPLVAAGCASTSMYDTHGFLTEYGEQQTVAELIAIGTHCESVYERYESEFFECLRPWVALDQRYDKVFAELTGEFLDKSRKIALDHESGKLGRTNAIEAINELYEDYNNAHAHLWDGYNKVIATSRARDEYQRRQIFGLAQCLASEMNQSSGYELDKFTCPGVDLGAVIDWARADDCLDKGGSYDYERGECDFESNHVIPEN